MLLGPRTLLRVMLIQCFAFSEFIDSSLYSVSSNTTVEVEQPLISMRDFWKFLVLALREHLEWMLWKVPLRRNGACLSSALLDLIPIGNCIPNVNFGSSLEGEFPMATIFWRAVLRNSDTTLARKFMIALSRNVGSFTTSGSSSMQSLRSFRAVSTISPTKIPSPKSENARTRARSHIKPQCADEDRPQLKKCHPIRQFPHPFVFSTMPHDYGPRQAIVSRQKFVGSSTALPPAFSYTHALFDDSQDGELPAIWMEELASEIEHFIAQISPKIAVIVQTAFTVLASQQLP